MTVLETAVESQNTGPKRKIRTMLIEFTSGEPKHLTEACLYQEPSAGYQRVKEVLKKRYGNPYMQLIHIWTSFDRGLEYQMEMIRQLEDFCFPGEMSRLLE